MLLYKNTSNLFNFRSIKISFLIASIYLKRNWKIITFVMFLIISLIFFQFKFNIVNLNSNIVSEGLVGTYQNHDLPVEVTRLLSTSLVDVDKNSRIVPKLVSGWKVNPDATNYKFTLKDNLTWSDGSLVKSSDIEFTIPNTEVSFPDDKTIEFKLKEAYSAFPSLLTKPVFKKGTLIGIGPYHLSKIEKSRIFITKLVLETKNPDLPKVIIRFYPNEKTALIGFQLGEVQSLFGINSKSTATDIVMNSSKTDYTKIVSIFFNTEDTVLSNRSLRQALSFAAPSIEGEVEANNPYPPFSWAYSKDIKDYLENSEAANAALDRAKSNSSKELIEKEIILTTTPQLEEVGKKVVAAWRELGLNAILRVESGIPQKFQALLITQSIPPDPDQYFLWHETQKNTNLTKYSQKRADKDLEDGRKLVEEEKRKEVYADFQKVLLEDAPAVFLYFPKYNVLFYNKSENRLNKVLPLQFTDLYKNN